MDPLWIYIPASFIGGGILVYFLEWLSRRGRLDVEQASLHLYFHVDSIIQYLSYFQLDIQFINTSGYQKVIRNLKARFYDGEKYHALQFMDTNLSPVLVIKERDAIEVSYKFSRVEERIEILVLHMYENAAFFEFTYSEENRVTQIIIRAEEIDSTDLTRTERHLF